MSKSVFLHLLLSAANKVRMLYTYVNRYTVYCRNRRYYATRRSRLSPGNALLRVTRHYLACCNSARRLHDYNGRFTSIVMSFRKNTDTVSHNKRATVFSNIPLPFLGRFFTSFKPKIHGLIQIFSITIKCS